MATASKFAEENETAKILVKLLESQLDLVDQQRVVIWNQTWRMPEDKGLYIVVRLLWSKPFAQVARYDPDTSTGLTEIQGANVQEHYRLEIMSSGSLARVYLPEVQFAMSSTAALQVQELNHMKFGSLSTGFRDTSYLDGSERINRFSVEFNILRAYERTREVAYYDKFTIPPIIHTNP